MYYSRLETFVLTQENKADPPMTLVVEGQDAAKHFSSTGEATAGALASSDTVLTPHATARPEWGAGMYTRLASHTPQKNQMKY